MALVRLIEKGGFNIGFTIWVALVRAIWERWFQYRLYYGSDNHCIDIRTCSIHFYGGCLATESYNYNTVKSALLGHRLSGSAILLGHFTWNGITSVRTCTKLHRLIGSNIRFIGPVHSEPRVDMQDVEENRFVPRKKYRTFRQRIARCLPQARCLCSERHQSARTGMFIRIVLGSVPR